jgi:hypothetical protein
VMRLQLRWGVCLATIGVLFCASNLTSHSP